MINAPHAERNPAPPSDYRAAIEGAHDALPSAAAMRANPKDIELCALEAQLDELLLAAPGMSAWVERVAVWEFNHRDSALVTQ